MAKSRVIGPTVKGSLCRRCDHHSELLGVEYCSNVKDSTLCGGFAERDGDREALRAAQGGARKDGEA